MTLFLKAVQNLLPGNGSFRLVGDDSYENIVEWVRVDNPPTEAQVNAEVIRLEGLRPWNELRTKRNQLLAETDYLALSDVTLSTEMAEYRQALRDLPANTTDPANPVWPTKPGG